METRDQWIFLLQIAKTDNCQPKLQKYKERLLEHNEKSQFLGMGRDYQSSNAKNFPEVIKDIQPQTKEKLCEPSKKIIPKYFVVQHQL